MIKPIQKYPFHCNSIGISDYQGFTIIELLNEYFVKINECIQISNESKELLEWIKEVGLKQEVEKMFEEWKNNGTWNDIINKELFGELNAKHDKDILALQELFIELSEQIESELAKYKIEIDNEIVSIKTLINDEIANLTSNVNTTINEFKSSVTTQINDFKNDVNDNLELMERNITSKLQKSYVDIKDFGAKGDNKTDDTIAVQKFLDFCSSTSLVGKVSSGTYLLSSKIKIKSNTSLIFENGIFKQTHSSTMIDIQDNSHTGYGGYTNIYIYKGHFDCDGANNLNPMNCIFLQHATNVKFEKCVFKNVRSYHSLDINGCENISVIDCIFADAFDDSGKTDREAIQIDLSAPTNENENAPCWDYTPSTKIYISGCKFYATKNNSQFYTSAIGSHNIRYDIYFSDIVIENCDIRHCTKYAITGWKWKSIRIENNVISYCDGGIKMDTPHRNALSANDKTGTYRGLQTSGTIYIRNNQIYRYKTEGIFLRGKWITSPVENESKGGEIGPAFIENNLITGYNDGEVKGIVTLNCIGITIKSNTVSGSNSDGIRMYCTRKSFCNNNIIFKPKNYGISISNATLSGTDGSTMSDLNIIDGNTIQTAEKCAIFITGESDASMVCNNLIDSCNNSASTSISLIDISSKSSNIPVIGNRFINIRTGKNIIFITNSCTNCLVMGNVKQATPLTYFNDSVNGIMVNNI